MGDIGFLKRKPRGWTAGHAYSRSHHEYDNPDEGWFEEVPTPGDLKLFMDVHWEVHVPGWPPYEMREVKREVPRWVRASSMIGKGRRAWSFRLRETHGLLREVGVPCLVSPQDRTRLWFDWDAAYAAHVEAWDRASGVARAADERRGGIDAALGKVVSPFRPGLDPRDAGKVDEVIDAERAEAQRAAAEGDLLVRAINMGFMPPKPAEHQTLLAHVRWCLHQFAHGIPARAIVMAIAPTGRQLCRTPVYEVRLDIEDGGGPRELVHHEVMNDRWAARLQPGTALTICIDPTEPSRIALDRPPSFGG